MTSSNTRSTNTNNQELVYRWLNRFLFILFPIVALMTIQDYGMGWDEVTRWNSGDIKVDYYEKLFSSDDPISVIQSTGADNYPGLFDVPLSILHDAMGWDRFLLGHWLAFLFGYLGLLALSRIGYIFGGSRLAFWSVLLLVLTPPFYGHWFHNPKDIPFAATYTVGLWALIECFRRSPRLNKRWLVIAAIACGLCMATRIAGLVLLAYFAAALMVLVVVHLWEKKDLPDWKGKLGELYPWLIGAPLFGLLAYLTLLPWWPAAHKNLFSVSASTLQRLHVSASEIPLFFNGQIMWAADAPAHYTLWMFAIKATEVFLIGLLLALPIAWLKVKRSVEGNTSWYWVCPVSVLILGGFFPLFYLTATAPALHNGVRHFLFAFPALSVCAAWGSMGALDFIVSKRPQLRPVFWIVLILLVVMPLVHLVRLHPYQYIYFNSLAGGPSGAYGKYEGEYWFTSSKHAIEQLDTYLNEEGKSPSEKEPIRLFILGPWQVAERFLPEGYELTGAVKEADYLILNTQMMVHSKFDGPELFRIERMGSTIAVVREGPAGNP